MKEGPTTDPSYTHISNEENSLQQKLFFRHDINTEIENGQKFSRSPPVFSKVIIIEKDPTFFDLLPLLFTIIIYGLVIQSICMIIKKTCRKFYDRMVFVILFICPPSFFLFSGKILFPFIWLTYAIFMIFIYYKINKKPLQKDMPRKTFDIFKSLFIITNIGIFIFQTLTIISFMFFPQAAVDNFLYLMIFVYFGLLSREVIFFLSETMASNTGFYSKEGVPSRKNNNSLCMICTKIFDNTELVHTLICNHSFHETCIKGWCIIAKKNSCPHCKKGVDLSTIPKDLWYRTEVWFYPLINTLRNFIVFSVSITILIFYKLSTGQK
ncbi:hypothetical protein P3W45_001714 [Vairimorpha bombi]|jgi:RING finger protein 121/175